MPSLSISTGILKNLDTIQNKISNATAASRNIALTLGAIDEISGNFFSKWMSFVYDELQKAGTMWRNFNDTAIQDTRKLGLTINDVIGYQHSLMEDSKELTYQYGIAASEVMKFQSSLAQATGRSQLLNEQERRNMAAMNKLLGPETMSATVKAFDELGGSVETATAHAAQTYEVAKRFGLDASQSSATFAKNLKLANTYNFSGGIQGITKMTLLSQKLKFNMESISRTADKFSTIEGAIESSAKLQMLGGNLGALFSNPMDAMYEALNDMEGFTNRIVAGMSQRGKFNKATGVVELSPQDKMLIKEQAEALGMSREELTNMVTQSTRNRQIESELIGKFTEEQKAYVTSQAKYDADTGKHYIERFNAATEQMEKVFTDELTADTVKELQNIAAPEEQMRGDVSDIKRLLMDKFDKDAKWLVTQREREKGMREGLSIAEAQTILVDTPMQAYGGIMNEASTGTSWINSVWKGITSGGFWTVLAMLTAIPAFKGIVGIGKDIISGRELAREAAKARDLMNGGVGSGAGAGSPIPGTGSTGPTHSRSGLNRARGKGGRLTTSMFDEKGQRNIARQFDVRNGNAYRRGTGQLASNAEIEQASRQGRVRGNIQRLKNKVKVPKLKTPKAKIPKLKGKAGLLASVAMMVGAGWLAGKAATPSEQAEGTTLEEGGIIEELKKQTALLEKISGVKASDLTGGEGSKESEEEASGFGVKDALAYSIYTTPVQKLIGKGATAGLNVASKTPGVGNVLGKGVEKLATVNSAWETKLAEKGAEKIVQGGASKIAGKAMTRLATKGIGGGPLALGGLVLDFANMGLKAAGKYEEGSTADKSMNIGSAALTGAGIGATLGSIIPGVGNLVGAAVGGIAGTVYGVVDQYGEEIKDWAGDKINKAKDFIFGTSEEDAMTGVDKAQQAFETSKIGITGIEDPALMQKAALATIGIHDLLISKWNVDNGKYANGAEKNEGAISKVGSLVTAPFRAATSLIDGATSLISDGVSTLFGAPFAIAKGIFGDKNEEKVGEGIEKGEQTLSSALFNINDIITKGYETGFPIYNVNGARRMPEVRSSGILGNLIKSTILATPIGMAATMISNPESFRGTGELATQGTPDINLNVTGTIKLDAGSSSAEIDVRKLLNDKQFMDKLTTIISENFQKNATMGVGRDMNNPARNTLGNTDVTSNRRR